MFSVAIKHKRSCTRSYCYVLFAILFVINFIDFKKCLNMYLRHSFYYDCYVKQINVSDYSDYIRGRALKFDISWFLN